MRPVAVSSIPLKDADRALITGKSRTTSLIGSEQLALLAAGLKRWEGLK